MPERVASGVSRCDLLVFDLDGTLVDSQQDLANAVNKTLAALMRAGLPDEEIVGFIGEGAATLLRRALDVSGGSTEAERQEALQAFIAFYRRHKLDNTVPYPGVVPALESIRAAAPDLPMAVLTNKPVGPSIGICDGLGLSRYLFANFGGDSFQTKKPHPEGLQRLMQDASVMLGRHVAPQRTILVGDSHVDVETARAAGALSIGCTYGLGPESLLAAQPDALAHSPAEWLPALEALLASSQREATGSS